jgi:hypothetical protein
LQVAAAKDLPKFIPPAIREIRDDAALEIAEQV